MAHDKRKPENAAATRGPVDPAGLKEFDTEKLKAISAPLVEQIGELEKLSTPAHELQERMRQLTDAMSGNSTLGKIARQIADQQKAIDRMRLPDLGLLATPKFPEPVLLRDIEIPENPAHETNERLERIEARFEDMQAIATEAAAIANGLQAAAAEFLVKFERAAGDNDRAARWAIRIGAAAIVIAVLAPLIQIIYTEFWRVPDDAAAMQAAIAEMKTEITGLKEEQANVAERLASALANADRDSAAILRDIRDQLGAMQPLAAPESVPGE